jgi:hypothetical protein
VTLNWLRQALASIVHDRRIVTVLWAGGGLILLGLAFWTGIAVGTSRPSRAPAFPFGRPFGDPRGDMAHGAFGSITRIDGDSITIMDPRFGQPRTISISPTTMIERGYRQRVRVGDLSVGENITVIGSPVSGNTIQASFIGVVDQPPLNFERFHAPPRPGQGRWPPPLQDGGGPYGQGA